MFLRIISAFILAASVFSAQAAVDVNKASQAELESVKGIGPGLSGKILQARKTGAFKDWADLVDRVGGVGTGNAKRFSQAGLTVSGTSYAGSVVAAEKSTTSGKSGKAAPIEGGSAGVKPAALR